jgi:GT2 family glycosyltransferase
LEKTTYQNYEILIVDNGSDEAEIFDYYKALGDNPKIRVLPYNIPFNYSAINNFAAKQAKGDYFLLLNNDIEIITPDWLSEMLSYAQRPDVGCVGANLYYPDDTLQHGGVIIGLGGVAGHAHKHFERSSFGYMSRMLVVQNLSAVTAACLLVSKKVYWEVGGLEESYAVAFNDVDFCMKVRAAGYLIIQTPHAQAYHYESKSRGYEDSPEKVKRFQGEIARFHARWDDVLQKGDPYYNPNLTLDREDFGFR